MSATRASAVVILCAGVLMTSCIGANWPYDLVKDTPVRSIGRPDGYRVGRFGEVIAPLPVPAVGSGEEARCVAVSAGPASPTAIYGLSRAGEIGGGLDHIYASDIRGDPFSGFVTGAALAAAPLWEYMDTDAGCLVVGEPGTEGQPGGFSRYCLSTTDVENPRRVEGSGLRTADFSLPVRVGRSVTVLPVPGTDPAELGYIVLGAEGSVHLVNRALARDLAPSLEPPAAIAAEDFGTSVAAGTLGDSWPAWVAVGSDGLVFVFAVWDDPSTVDADPDHAWLQACYESPARAGFGTLVFSADVDGDGRSDLAVSARADVEDRTEEVILVRGTAFHDGAPPDPYPTVSCVPVPEDVVFACDDFPPRDVSCGTHPGFGASFAAGDLDGDGSNEVVIGAPHSEVEGKGTAGAVLVYDPSDPTTPISALRDAVPVRGARVGASVAVTDIAGEDEVLAGSPGSDEVFVFFCSGVGDDSPGGSSTDLCR